MKKIVSICSIAAVLSACAPKEPPKSEQYFEAHPDEISAVLENCKKNAGAANCDSAGAAQAIIAQKKWISTPPTRGIW